MTTRSFEETTARSIVFGAANRLTATRTAQTILERVIREAVSDRFATEVLDDCTTKKNRELVGVQKQPRHSDPRITLGIYGHVVSNQQRDAVENRSARIAKFAVN